MERFVFVAAVAIAVIFGIGAVFGGPNFHFAFDEDGGGTAPMVEVSPGRMDARVFTGTDLRIKGAAVTVVIVPEDRADFLIEIDNSAGRAPMPAVSIDGERVIIDGQVRGRIGNCSETSVDLRGYGDIALAELPRITIRAPRSFGLDRSGAGTTEIGATQSLDLEVSGCSTATVGDVAGELSVDLAGSGRINAGAVGSLDADVAGSGDIAVGAVAAGANIDIAGSGAVTLASLNGDFSTDGAGSGSVTIQGGTITMASVDLAGSGDITIGASVQTLDVNIVGSGDVDVTGTVGDIDAEIAGSGNVTAAAVTGTVRKEVWGSGDVQVGR